MQPFITHIIVVLVGLIALLFSINFQSKLKKIKQHGEEADGIVFDFQGNVRYNGSSNTRNPVIRFVTKKQQWITKESDVGFTWGMQKEGDKVKVIYDIENPENFFITSPYSSETIAFIIIFISAILILIGLILLLFDAGLLKF